MTDPTALPDTAAPPDPDPAPRRSDRVARMVAALLKDDWDELDRLGYRGER